MCVLLNMSRVWDRAKHCNNLAILCQFVTLNLFPQWQHNHIWKSDKNLHDCILHPWLAVYWNTSTIRGNKVMTKHSLSPNNFCFCFSLTKILRDKLSPKAWKLQPKKWWDNPMKNRPFLLQIAAIHTSVRYNTHIPPVLQSKLYLQVLSMVLYCWHYW